MATGEERATLTWHRAVSRAGARAFRSRGSVAASGRVRAQTLPATELPCLDRPFGALLDSADKCRPGRCRH